MSGRLEGRVAIVTGGAGFIGKAIAKRFCEEGAQLVVADLDGSRWDEFVTSLGLADPSKVTFAQANARSDEDIKRVVASVVEQFGRIDILVPMVGGSKDAMFHKMTEEQWDEVIDLNLRSTFLACRAVVPQMIEQHGGKIILMSSRSYMGNIGQVNYSTAKAGIIGFTSSLAREMARHHVNVNCVVPGFIDNPRLASMEEKYRLQRVGLNPFGEVGTTADVANAIVFLGSDEAAQVTGQALHVASW